MKENTKLQANTIENACILATILDQPLCVKLDPVDRQTIKLSRVGCFANLDSRAFFADVTRFDIGIYQCTRPISQIPPCIRQISHNAPFCKAPCAHYCYKLVRCEKWCIVVGLVHSGICVTGLFIWMSFFAYSIYPQPSCKMSRSNTNEMRAYRNGSPSNRKQPESADLHRT